MKCGTYNFMEFFELFNIFIHPVLYLAITVTDIYCLALEKYHFFIAKKAPQKGSTADFLCYTE